MTVVSPSGEKVLYPDLSEREEKAAVEYINKSIGISLPPAKVPSLFSCSVGANSSLIPINVQIAEMLKRMGLTSQLAQGGKDVVVRVPPTRSDILHACDIMEDVAIAYGYNNLTLTVPRTPTVAKQQHLNKFTDLLRHEVAFAGYYEAFTFSLVRGPNSHLSCACPHKNVTRQCSAKENFAMLNRKDDGTEVRIDNPATKEFEVGRTSLLVGLLKAVSANKDQVTRCIANK